MSREHHIIYIPGLKDQSRRTQFLLKFLPVFWDPKEFPIHVVSPHWEEGSSFKTKLKMITDKVDELVKDHDKVSIVGQSAGGCGALSGYAVRKNVLVAAIDATGRLRAGENVYPSLERAARYSSAFFNGVQQFEEKYAPTLTMDDRKRILTIRPMWDEIVPASTVYLEGATNLVAPMIEHIAGGVFIMSVYARVLQDFLRSFDSSPPPHKRNDY